MQLMMTEFSSNVVINVVVMKTPKMVNSVAWFERSLHQKSAGSTCYLPFKMALAMPTFI